MDSNAFIHSLGELGRLVLLSLVLERALAWLFENEIINSLLTREAPTATTGTRARQPRVPGIKSLIAFAIAAIVCFKYDFNVFFTILHTGTSYERDTLGIWLTAGAVSGGSAGAIALFQSALNLNKEVRDAQTAAKIARAAADKQASETMLARQLAETASAKQIADLEVITAAARKEAAEHAASRVQAEAAMAKAAAARAGG